MDLGFSNVWDNQGTFNASSLVVCIKAKLKETFISIWKDVAILMLGWIS